MDPAPAPWELAGDRPRDDVPGPVRTAARHLAGLRPWAELDFPDLVEALLALGRTDVPLARLVEGHVDGLRTLAEAGVEARPDALYAVWASRSRGSGLRAEPDADRDGDGWLLDGALEFTSGAGIVDRALVPTSTERGDRLLDVAVDAWDFDGSRWRTRAMQVSRTHRVDLARQRATGAEVGGDGWYLARRGFWIGGIGVAAVWAGGAARVHDLLDAAAPGDRRTPAQALRLGRVRTDVATGVALCRDAAVRVDDVATEDLAEVAALVRSGVAAAVRRVLDEARSVAGAVGLALDEDLTRAIDDLTLYVAQHNADADAVRLGSAPS